MFPTLNDYNPPYEKILESRKKVAAAILDVQAVLAAVKPPAKR